MFERLLASWQQQNALLSERVAAGKQPTLPYADTTFLLWANVFYLGFTFVLHRYMKQREHPFRCKPFKSILLVYNASCVLLAGYVVWGIYVVNKTAPYKFVCNPTVTPGSDLDRGHAEFAAHVFWVFYAQKFWEFLDTWFFIARKSFRQVTFLHVFHHCSINIVVGLVLPFEFNGDMYLPILLNAIVHVLMYGHYLVSALGLPTPWKPWLTSLQLLQFVTIATQSTMSLMAGDGCGGPYFGKITMVAYMGSMLLLFGNFFWHAYILKKPARFGGGVVKELERNQVTKTHAGRVQLDGEGCVTVALPGAFGKGELVSYQVTAIGRPMPELHVCAEPTEEDCTFSLAGGVANAAVCYTVTAVLRPDEESKKPPSRRTAAWCCGTGNDNAQDAQAASCCGDQGQTPKKNQ